MPTYDDALEAYLREHFAIEDDVLITIRENIAACGLPQISINPEDGRFLEFIAAAELPGSSPSSMSAIHIA
jgi:caffeoyl-CoA O-methyltransferase